MVNPEMTKTRKTNKTKISITINLLPDDGYIRAPPAAKSIHKAK
jgi:hypothetical protein